MTQPQDYNAEQVQLIELAVKGFCEGMGAIASMHANPLNNEQWHAAQCRRDEAIERGVRATAHLAASMMPPCQAESKA